MNLLKLRSEIIAKFKTQEAFAQKIGWHKSKVTRLLKGKYSPDTDEVSLIALP